MMASTREPTETESSSPLASREQSSTTPPLGYTCQTWGLSGFSLENPEGAEIHALIAPHGQLDYANYPDELYDPTGNSKCGCRWIAYFSPPR